MPERTQIFVSYSHHDGEHLARLKVHLRPFERKGLVELWSDAKIKAGDLWRDEIREAIDKSAVAILLVSADFLASDFISEEELPPLLDLAATNGLVVMPVVLKPCAFLENESISRYQAINPADRPLISLDENGRESAWNNLADRVRELLPSSSPGNMSEDVQTVELVSAPDSHEWDPDLAIFGEEIRDPSVIDDYFVYSYHFVDTLAWMTPASFALAKVPEQIREKIFARVRNRLLNSGWEGDGEIQVLWLPPFTGAGVEDTFGICVWHVKQLNNGTSWMASPVLLPFDSFNEQNPERALKGESGITPHERNFDDLLELTKREILANIGLTGFSASELLTVVLEELRRHRDYASLPDSLLSELDVVFRAASSQNSMGQTVGRSSANTNHKNYIKVAKIAAAAIAEHLESVGRLQCSFKAVEVNSRLVSRGWEIEITNAGDHPVVECYVQLDDLWFVESDTKQTLDRFPTSIPLRWVGPSSLNQTTIAPRGKRRFELLAHTGAQMSGKIEIAYDEPGSFRDEQSLSVDDRFFMQLSITSSNSKPEFIVIRVDPPVVKSLILRGLNEQASVHQPPVEIVYQEMHRASRNFAVPIE